MRPGSDPTLIRPLRGHLLPTGEGTAGASASAARIGPMGGLSRHRASTTPPPSSRVSLRVTTRHFPRKRGKGYRTTGAYPPHPKPPEKQPFPTLMEPPEDVFSAHILYPEPCLI